MCHCVNVAMLHCVNVGVSSYVLLFFIFFLEYDNGMKGEKKE